MWSAFRRPFGLFLSGGGALGCWQAAVLREFADAGVRVDAVMGISVGALNGAALALGRARQNWTRWSLTDGGVMRLDVRLRPFSLFSNDPLGSHVETEAEGDEGFRAFLRCPLTVVSVARDERRRVYGLFTPRGRAGWDAPLKSHLMGSCAIPGIFPPVQVSYRGAALTLVDGGVEARDPLDLAPLAGCRDIVILDSCRIEDSWTDYEAGVRALQESPWPPRVYRLVPSSPLRMGLFDFRAASIARGLVLGMRDARRFLREPRSALVSPVRLYRVSAGNGAFR